MLIHERPSVVPNPPLATAEPPLSRSIIHVILQLLAIMGNLVTKEVRRQSSESRAKGKSKMSRFKSKSTTDVAAQGGPKLSSASKKTDTNHKRTRSLKEPSSSTTNYRSKSTVRQISTEKSSVESTSKTHPAQITTSSRSSSKEKDAEAKGNKNALLLLKVSKKDPKLTPGQKSLLRESWETSPHGEIGTRIYSRLFQKRADIKRAYDQMAAAIPGHTWKKESAEFTEFVNTLVYNLDDSDAVQAKCWERGKYYAPLREHGFKPQFWVPMSEIMTTECLYLDRGLNPVADVVDAWAALISLMLSQMRDGFYAELRNHRQQSKRRMSQHHGQNSHQQSSTSSYNLYNSDSLDLSPAAIDIESISASGRLYGRESSLDSIVPPQLTPSPYDAFFHRASDDYTTSLTNASALAMPLFALTPALTPNMGPLTAPNDNGGLVYNKHDDRFSTPPSSPPHPALVPALKKLTVIEDVNENIIGF